MFFHPADAVGGVVEEFVVGFVQYDDDIGRNRVDKSFQFGIGNAGAGGIVGVGDKHDFGFRVDRLENGGQVVMEFFDPAPR